MDDAGGRGAEVMPGTVGALADLAAHLGRASAQVLLARASALRAAYRAALLIPETFARSTSLSQRDPHGLVERSIRADFAVALGMSERDASRLLEQAQLLFEDLPCTRAALAEGRLLWEAGEVICAAASTLPVTCRAALDEQAAEAALRMTPTQLRKAVGRMREELHEQPFAERHARAREDRKVWLSREIDGMAVFGALLPAPVAVAAYNRFDRIARIHRDDTAARASGSAAQSADPNASTNPGADASAVDHRTLAQLRADSFADLLINGDIAGTTPPGDGPATMPTYVPGIRADIRLTLPASTAAGLDDTPADLDGYGLIPADLARELVSAGASFTEVLTDPGTGTVASVGRTRRLPSPQMRLHLQLRDQTCRFPGCTRPASTSEADHTIEWRNGGETSLENMCSLCTGHHHVRHGDRWTYRLHPDGTADWTTPTGRRVTTRPPALAGRALTPPAGRAAGPPAGQPPGAPARRTEGPQAGRSFGLPTGAPPRSRFDDDPPPF